MKNLRHLFITLLFASLSLILFSNFQIIEADNTNKSETNQLPFTEKENKGWYQMKPNTQVSVDELLERVTRELGFGPNDKWINYKTETDDIGITHYRFQHYHKEIKVIGAILLIHEREGAVRSFNGEWSSGLNLQVPSNISSEKAIAFALQHFPADQYMWEDESAEKMLCHLRKQKDATFYPQPELVWIKTNSSSINHNYQLVYKMNIQAEIPLINQEVYLDANTGGLIKSINLIHNCNIEGTAVTKYSGTHSMKTDSVGPNSYRLQETCHGHGVETYDLNQSINYSDAVDFTDTDNFWDNENADQDEAATDVHWGAQMTFEYLESKHNYIGLDNDSMAMISFVHYDVGFENAFWNGVWATFGDGNSNLGTSPLTTLDIVAHEFCHGVTQFNANLEYLNESGALNESFSDIMGALVEFWATPNQGDWKLGEDFDISGVGLRSMSDPNSLSDPDTYLGNFWFTGIQDNGGVHTNSSVQNFWFYLLTEGGTGTNDNNEIYQVEPLGLDTAANIAFRNLRFYLTENSTYDDAREGALQAAEDLYGVCSFAYIQTANAWQAVGLGNAISLDDVRPLSLLYPTPVSCALSDMEFPLLLIRYNGCNTDLDVATSIPIGFQLNNGPIVNDTIELTSPLAGGDNLDYQADVSISGLEQPGTHILRVWTAFNQDQNKQNDTLEFELLSVLDQNSDFGMETLAKPGSGCFLGNEVVDVGIGFFGCDSIIAGTDLNIFYRLNGGTVVMENYLLPQTIYSFETFNYTFSTPLDFTNESGTNELESWVEFSSDIQNDNDVLDVQFITNPKKMVQDDVLTFEVPATQDSLFITLNPVSNALVTPEAAVTGTMGLQMTGGDAGSNIAELSLPNGTDNWVVNEITSAKICFCVDATSTEGLSLSFDLKQTYTSLYLLQFGLDTPGASSLRVLIDDQQISQTFTPTTYTDDLFVNHQFDLTPWVNSSIEVCIETRNILAPEFDPFNQGDNAFIDNIKVSGILVSTNDLEKDYSTIAVYPNPTEGQLNLSWQTQGSGEATISIYDIYGRKIEEQTQRYVSGTNSFSLSLTSASPGAYFINISDGQLTKTTRIIKL